MPRARMRADLKERLAATLPAAPAGLADLTARSVSGSGRVAEQVRVWIFEGTVRDGDVISQEDLAELFGVSRVPVRDALISLAASGWVLLEPGIGARAIGLDAAAVRDSFELMGTIWSLLARRAVERGTPPGGLLAAAAGVKGATTPQEMTAANTAFLDELRALADAPRLDAAFRGSARIVPGDFFAVVPHAVEVQRQHVPKIAAAIRAGDVERAGTLAIELLRRHARSIADLLATRGALGTATGRPAA
jgi:DNA-binding GntR family transcriptional regulator